MRTLQTLVAVAIAMVLVVAMRAAAAPPATQGAASLSTSLSLLRMGDYDGAIAQLSVLDGEDAAVVSHALGFAYMQVGNYQEASKHLDKAASASKPPARVLVLNRAVCHMVTRNPMRAAKELVEYIRRTDEPDEVAVNLLGAALMRAAEQAEHATRNAVYRDAEQVIETQVKKMEKARPGYVRWGTEWVEESVGAARRVELERALAYAEERATLMRSAASRVDAAEKGLKRERGKQFLGKPSSVDWAQSVLSSARQAYDVARDRWQAAKEKVPEKPWVVEVKPFFPLGEARGPIDSLAQQVKEAIEQGDLVKGMTFEEAQQSLGIPDVVRDFDGVTKEAEWRLPGRQMTASFRDEVLTSYSSTTVPGAAERRETAVERAIAAKRLMKGMTMQQAYLALGEPTSIEETAGKETRVGWRLGGRQVAAVFERGVLTSYSDRTE